MSTATETSKTLGIIQSNGLAFVNLEIALQNRNNLFSAIRASRLGDDQLDNLVKGILLYKEEAKKAQDARSKAEQAASQISADSLEAMGLTRDDLIESLINKMAKQAGQAAAAPAPSAVAPSTVAPSTVPPVAPSAPPATEGGAAETARKPRVTSGQKANKKRAPRFKIQDENGEWVYYSGVGPAPTLFNRHKLEHGGIEALRMSDDEIAEEVRKMEASGIEVIHSKERVGAATARATKPAIRTRFTKLDMNDERVQQLLLTATDLKKVPPVYKITDADGTEHWSTGRGRYMPTPFVPYKEANKLKELVIPEREQSLELVKKLRSENQADVANQFIALESTLLKLNGTAEDLEEMKELLAMYDSKLGVPKEIKELVSSFKVVPTAKSETGDADDYSQNEAIGLDDSASNNSDDDFESITL